MNRESCAKFGTGGTGGFGLVYDAHKVAGCVCVWLTGWIGGVGFDVMRDDPNGWCWKALTGVVYRYADKL